MSVPGEWSTERRPRYEVRVVTGEKARRGYERDDAYIGSADAFHVVVKVRNKLDRPIFLELLLPGDVQSASS